jgi:peptidoglycan-N-acetylglucosamine deacetylase
MSRGTICLTFDFDAVSLWMVREMTTPTPVSRGEFGAVAVPRILNLLAERDLKSTWFIPGHTIETYPEVCREIVEAGHEAALHGYAHENVAVLDEKTEREVFRRSHELVGNLAGSAPKGFRAPSWDLSSHTIDIMLELALTYDSSLMSHDYAVFYCRRGDEIPPDGPMKFGESTNLVELPISWTLDDYPHFEYLRMPGLLMPGLRSPETVFKSWTDDVSYMLRDFEDGVLTITFHPQVIGRGHRLLGLERWLDELREMDLTFERMDSVAEQFVNGRSFGRYRRQSGVRG